jgi:hypothetical protein
MSAGSIGHTTAVWNDQSATRTLPASRKVWASRLGTVDGESDTMNTLVAIIAEPVSVGRCARRSRPINGSLPSS